MNAQRHDPTSEPSDWRDALIFLVGSGWGVMCAIGMMAAWGIHP